MAFAPTFSNLANATQTGFLARAFAMNLFNVFAYRYCATPFDFPGRIGQSITETRPGLMIPNTTPLDPSINQGLDNGLTPQTWSVEQFTLMLIQLPNVAPDINLLDDETSIASLAVQNAIRLGNAQGASIDLQARKTLFNAYMSGNTFATQNCASGDTSIPVNDIRGFQTIYINGKENPVSTNNPLPIYINGGMVGAVTNATPDETNVSLAKIAGGVSGTLTVTALSSGFSAASAIVSKYAPKIIRPNGKLSTAQLTSSDTFNPSMTRAGTAYLRNNAIPTNDDGYYHNISEADNMNQFQSDPEFQNLVRGRGTDDQNVNKGWTDEVLSTRFMQSTLAPIQEAGTIGAVTIPVAVRRPIMTGKGALIEGIFNKGMDAIKDMAQKVGRVALPMDIPHDYVGMNNQLGNTRALKNVYIYMRPPLDRLGETISMASNYVGGFTAPTDVTANSTTIPTASNAIYKRAVIFETA